MHVIAHDVIFSTEMSYYVTAPSGGEQYFLSHMENMISDAKLKCHVDDVTEGKAIISVQGQQR